MEKEDIKKFLKEEYGIEPEDMRWLASYKKTVNKYGDWVAQIVVKSFVAAILSGIGYLLWQGFHQAMIHWKH